MPKVHWPNITAANRPTVVRAQRLARSLTQSPTAWLASCPLRVIAEPVGPFFLPFFSRRPASFHFSYTRMSARLLLCPLTFSWVESTLLSAQNHLAFFILCAPRKLMNLRSLVSEILRVVEFLQSCQYRWVGEATLGHHHAKFFHVKDQSDARTWRNGAVKSPIGTQWLECHQCRQPLQLAAYTPANMEASFMTFP